MLWLLWLKVFFFIFNYMLDSANFSYSGANGPEKWGSLSPSFAACSNGKAQSPVDLAWTDIVMNQQLQSFDRHYLPTNATLVNNKFNLGVCSSFTKITIFFFFILMDHGHITIIKEVQILPSNILITTFNYKIVTLFLVCF